MANINKEFKNALTILEAIGLFGALIIAILATEWSSEMKLAVVDFVLIIVVFLFTLTYKTSKPKTSKPKK